MSILDTELKRYAAANRPEDDVSAGGGAIDLTCTLDVTQLAATDTLSLVSDNAGDTTQNVTVRGRDASGAIISDIKTLNGTTPVAVAGTMERFLTENMDAVAAGTVTLSRATGGATVAAMPSGVTDAAIQFINAASESGATTRYTKEFWKNTNVSLTLTAAKVQLSADPAAIILIGVHTSKDDSATIANRKTAPAGITFVDDGVDQDVPGTQLEFGSAIGVWVEMQLGAGAAAQKTSYTTQLAGSTI